MNRPNRAIQSILPSPGEKAQYVQKMFDTISPRYDLVNRLMTMRMDLKWRTFAIAQLGLRPNSLMLDVACGTGDFVRMLGSKNYRVVGIDFSFGMLAASNQHDLIQGDASKLPFKNGSFDGLTCGFALRNFVDLEATLVEMARVLRRGGKVALVEVARPKRPIIKELHGIYFDRIVPAIGAALSSREAYKYLPASTSYLPEENELKALIKRTGFEAVEFKYFMMGAAQVITATKA
ncbi:MULTISPECIES: ubiquinone/menaquinone biosynthesis methyltransferase [Acidithrix]|uniref:Demethylmenaquinone methyltransferase n=1 Tax=Acidithrix ferrooxidans TaxID=1280514 RepID=A0A0D8HID8_9ACTN|nr:MULTISPECIES: ubiquinone/menaquinone biosynthesis methyltransferase [Acidithrix]KJF17755.1 demethylmenaquinone methyltransferase [Acidithrix ferrooxidans]CAG4922455.1 unnamed protein product [Acidithrix sp. C25]